MHLEAAPSEPLWFCTGDALPGAEDHMRRQTNISLQQELKKKKQLESDCSELCEVWALGLEGLF